MYCKNCGNQIDENAAICVNCGFAKGTGNLYCQNCGNQTAPGAQVCMNCGHAIENINCAPGEQKSKIAAGLLGIFLGSFGVHNFYLGYTKKAVIQLVVSLAGGLITCGIATVGVEIWGLIEGIMILTGSIDKDGKGNPLKD